MTLCVEPRPWLLTGPVAANQQFVHSACVGRDLRRKGLALLQVEPAAVRQGAQPRAVYRYEKPSPDAGGFHTGDDVPDEAEVIGRDMVRTVRRGRRTEAVCALGARDQRPGRSVARRRTAAGCAVQAGTASAYQAGRYPR